MSKRAFCVGINDYPYDGSDLNGCVNDAHAWAALLRDHFDFPTSDVKVITDAEATKTNMVAGIKRLLKSAKKGDVLVFTNSSHGSYVADTDGDEERYDEVLCPYDIDSNALKDDELRELFQEVPEGARLTVISDSCHSGTVTRAAIAENLPGWLRPPDDRRVRFLNPALRGERVLANPWKAPSKRHEKHPESKMKDVLLSGCTDKEYSYDALLNGTYHGAMTFHAIQAITAANYRISYAQLHSRVGYMLDTAGYPQHPQLEGKQDRKRQQIFS